MQFATAKEGETLAELTARVYKTSSDADLKRVLQRVREVNPTLKAQSKLKAGVFVVVPEVEGVEPSKDAHDEGEMLKPLVEKVREQLGDLRQALDPALDRQETTLKGTLDLAASSEVQKLAKQDKFVRERLGSTIEAAQRQLKRVQALRELQAKAADELKIG